MNYMINDPASKEVAIAFAKWVVLNGTWQSDSDLTFDQQYERWYGDWMKELDNQAHDARLAYDTVDMDEYDDFERQLEYMSGAYED
jgi:hypothetical protein